MAVWDLKERNNIVRGNLNYRDATRGIHAIGYNPSVVNTVEQLNLASTGNATSNATYWTLIAKKGADVKQYKRYYVWWKNSNNCK